MRLSESPAGRTARVTLSAASRHDLRVAGRVGDRVHVAMAGQRLDELGAQARQQVDDARRDVGHAEHLAEVQRQPRPALGDDRHHDVAGGERRQDLGDEAEHVGLVGAITPTTPDGSGIVKLKCGVATGLTEPSTAWTLSVQPA